MTARSASPAVTPKIASRSRGRSTSVPVKVIAGCSAIGRAPTAAASAEHGEPVRTAGVDDVLALVDRAARTQHRDDVGQHVVGDGEEQQVGGARSIAGLDHRGAGEEGLDAATGGVGLTGGGHDLVARGAQRGGEDGADAACAHDTHTELSHCEPFRSSPADHPCVGPVWVPDSVLDLLHTERTPPDPPCEQEVNVTYPTLRRSAGLPTTGTALRRAGAASRGPGRRRRTGAGHAAARCGSRGRRRAPRRGR